MSQFKTTRAADNMPRPGVALNSLVFRSPVSILAWVLGITWALGSTVPSAFASWTVSSLALNGVLAGAISNDETSTDETSPKGREVEEIDLTVSLTAPQTTRVTYVLKNSGKFSALANDGDRQWDYTHQAYFDFDQRRFPHDGVGPMFLRAARRFTKAGSASVMDGEKHESLLPNQSRLIYLYGREPQVVQLSPDVRLTREQLDMLEFPCDPLVAVGLLPGRKLRDKSEKWNTDSWVVPMLAGLDATIQQSAVCQIKSLTETTAVITFECSISGASYGSAVESSFRGELVFDRRESIIRQLSATLTQKRTPGMVNPGLTATADISWTQEPVESANLPEMIPMSEPAERQLLLTMVTPWRVLMLHCREWHIYKETSELVMFRMLHNGSLIGQLNISSAPLLSAGAFTPEDKYLEEVQKAVSARSGRVVSSTVEADRNGWRIHHVQAKGTPQKVPFTWDYFLCTTKAGEQISLAFSHADEDAKLFDGQTEQFLNSMTIRSSRPKIALPR